MKKQVWVLGLVFLIMALGVTVAFGETTINVSTHEQLIAAQNTINTNGGAYTINLQEDIESFLGISNSDAVVTLVGNGHTLSTKTTAISVSGGILNLGDGQTELIIAYTGSDPDNDNPGLVYVNEESGTCGTCNMKDKVIIRDSKKNNYFGAGVTVQGGTFHMYGGTIRDCSMVSGSVCYGGGVAVFAGGKFIMDGGVIKNCSAVYKGSGAADNRQIMGVGGGVFVSSGGNFTMEGGIIENCKADYGAGVALVMSLNEYFKYYYYSNPRYNFGRLDSVVTINGGEIIRNNASFKGGGIFASGLLYVDAVPLATHSPEGGV